MPIHVYIATTRGPIAVRRLTREEEDVESCVCVELAFDPLPISAAYRDFVNKGSGLLHRDFGSPAYRLDLSARIDRGLSWQLPVYLAHHLESLGVLGDGKFQPGDHVLWATGAVKVDRTVVGVEGLPDKLASSQALFAELQAQDIPVLLLTPEQNVQTLDALAEDWRRAYQQFSIAQLIAVPELDAALDTFAGFAGLAPAPDEGGTQHADSRDDQSSGQAAVSGAITNRGFKRWPLLAAVVAAAGLSYGALSHFGKATGQLPPPSPPASATVEALDDFTEGDEVARREQREQWRRQRDAEALKESRLAVRLGEYPGDCDPAYIVERVLRPHDDAYPAVPIERLCGLALEPVDEVHAVVGVALDNGALLPITHADGAWQINTPKQRDHTRDYALLLLQNVEVNAARQMLEAALRTHAKSSRRVDVEILHAIMRENRWRGEVYSHSLRFQSRAKRYSGY